MRVTTVTTAVACLMSNKSTQLSVSQLAQAYRSGQLDPVEVAQEHLDAIAAHPEGSKVFRVVTAERALQQARAAKRQFEAGVDLGLLQGVPVAIKDLVDMEGEVSAAGSRVMADRPPAASDSPVAARLAAAGAVFLGRTNMTELAYSGLGMNPHYGTPGCVQDRSRIPGGSSSGSGVAVADGLATVAVGSDTGGSVRIPAAVNGVVGLKTTDGRLPTEGTMALSTTLDTLGPMARTVDDAWALYLAMAAEQHRPIGDSGARLTLLAPTTLLQEDLDSETRAGFAVALERLEALGHEVRHQPLPIMTEVDTLYSRYGNFSGPEAWALYEEEFRSRAAEFDPRVMSRVRESEGRTAIDYIRLGYARAQLKRRFWAELAGVDAIVASTIPHLPAPIADLLTDDEAYGKANRMILRNTAPFNILGCPAVSVPVRPAEGAFAISLMIVTRPGEEELAMSLARQFEASA